MIFLLDTSQVVQCSSNYSTYCAIYHVTARVQVFLGRPTPNIKLVECYSLMASGRVRFAHAHWRWTYGGRTYMKCTRQRGVWRMRIWGGRTVDIRTCDHEIFPVEHIRLARSRLPSKTLCGNLKVSHISSYSS